MSEHMSVAVVPETQVEDSGLSLLALLVALAAHKKFILITTLTVALIAVGLTLLMPNVYRASAKLLPPQQAQSGAMGLLSQLGGAAGMASSIAGIKSPNDLYVGMLRSRTVADQLLAKHELMKFYETNSAEKARLNLAADTAVSSGKDGLISISVDSTDKKLAAALANSYVATLIKLTGVLAVTEASQRRLFYERQLEESKDKLALAEVTLKKSLNTSGVISVDSDSRAIVETVARIRAQVSAKEIELGAMRAFLTPGNPEYRRTQEELGSLRSELSRLENGRPDSPAQAGSPQVGLGNIKILRDVKYYQMLYELLAKQYEVARLDEARDSSVIQVLDAAIEPEFKVKPGRAVMVLLAAVLAFFVACLLAVLFEVKRKIEQDPDQAQQFTELKKNLRFR